MKELEKSAEVMILGVFRFGPVHICALKYICEIIGKIFVSNYDSSQASLNHGQKHIISNSESSS